MTYKKNCDIYICKYTLSLMTVGPTPSDNGFFLKHYLFFTYK